MMTTATLPINEPQTLARRLAQGRIPAADAQRYALFLAEALRKIHEAGQVHGGVSPDLIVLTGSGLELGPARHTTRIITPYTAPELLEGQPPDSRSDLFAFGAVVYEMFSGRRAFAGDSPDALSAAIRTTTPPSCGSPAMDRLVRNCLAKDPGTRWQRMHKVLMEIKLLSVSARRAEASAARSEPAVDAGLRAEVQQIEDRVTARLLACEKTVAEIQHAAAELRGQLAATCDQQNSIPERFLEATDARIEARIGRLDLEANSERMLRLEQGLDAASKHIANLHDSVAGDFLEFEQGLKAQAAAIQSARTAMAQTDDLVERVVDAIDSLQSAVLEPHADLSAAIN